MLFYNYLQYQITDTLKKGQPFINRTEPKINQGFFNNEFYKSYLNSFNKAFIGWMKEMDENKRTFSPLRFDKKLNTLVNGLEAKKGWRKLSYSHFDNMLNAAERQKDYAEIEEKFMHIFYNATKRICEESFFKN